MLQSSQPLGAVSLLHYTTRHSMTVLTVFCLAKVARSDTGWRQNLWNRWSCGTRSSKLAVQVRAVLSQRWSVDCVVVYAYRSCISFHCFCPTTECLAGDVRPEHPAAAGVDGIARLRRPPYEEPWGARNGSFDSAFSKAPASTFTSTSYLLRLLCPRLSFYFHLLFFFFDLDCR